MYCSRQDSLSLSHIRDSSWLEAGHREENKHNKISNIFKNIILNVRKSKSNN